VDEKYVIKKIRHTKQKVEGMRIEILLKRIRKEKRNKFRTIVKNDRIIKFTLELYREERKRTDNISIGTHCTSIKYKN